MGGTNPVCLAPKLREASGASASRSHYLFDERRKVSGAKDFLYSGNG
jgi:hypothetical protein